MKEVAIKEICTKGSSSLKQKELLPEGKYPVYGASGIAGYLDTFHQESNYIGIVKDGSGIGRVAFYPEKTSLIGTMQYILPKKGFNIRYIGYCLQSLDLSKYKQGAAIPHIYFRDYGERIVKVTDDENEQLSIVSRLDAAFAHIDSLKANAEKQLAEARQLFQAELAECMRPKEGWEEKTLGEIATDMYRGSGIKRDQITKEGTPCVRYGEIYTTYNVAFDECVSHTCVEIIHSPKYFEYGDLLFAITGESVEDIGKTIAYLGKDKCLLGGDIICMKHRQNAKFLSYALSTPDAIRQKGIGKTKLKVVHTNAPALKAISIPIPLIDIQQSIVSRLDSFSANIKKLEEMQRKTLAECDALKQAMLREVFE